MPTLEFPKEAAAAGLTFGAVVVECDVETAGRLVDCQAVSGPPSSMGFERPAVDYVSRGWLRPISAAQAGEGARITTTVHFKAAEPDGPLSARVFLEGSADVETAKGVVLPVVEFPERAAGRGVGAGVAQVDCGVTPTGALTDCEVLSEIPSGMGFGLAVLDAAEQGRVTAGAMEAVQGRRVTFGMNFSADQAPLRIDAS